MSQVLLRRLGAALVAALLLAAAPVAYSGVAVAAPAVHRSAAAVTATATPVASSAPVAAVRGYRTLSRRGYQRPLGHRGFGRGFFLWWILRSALRGGIGLFILLALVAVFAIAAMQRRGGPRGRW
ncbi:MAG TPA: hypothetical protein VFT50_10055 [Baekduia sp.]|nr:hypothetical protein [Baekduia sp.]